MQHVLIIDQDMAITEAVEARLARHGFTSFSHVWSREEALAEAHRRRPDLLLVGDSRDGEEAIDAARRISDRYGTPVLFVTGNPERAKRSLPSGVSMGGPFLLREMDTAVRCAQAKGLH